MSNEEKVRTSGEVSRPEPSLPTVNPAADKSEPPKPTFHPAVYVGTWITLSSSVILFNKHILDYAQFRFPIILTTWHLAFATLMTQILARTTNLLDGRKTVKMTGRVYLRAIVPIGIFFSLSLICGNVTYLYLSVAFIQMLKATTPVAVLLATWGMGMAPANLKVLTNVSVIVLGVIIASFGEIKFVFIGFVFQIAGIIFEATRLVMVQRLLSSAEYKMDPLVSLYYFAPVCAVMNGVTALFLEVPTLTMGHIYNVGVWTLLANAMVAFMLNVSVVFLIGKTSSLVMTLCGVLKDILLVVASMMIWNTPVTALQFFGYSIALIGLVYYKLGGDKIKEYTSQANRAWAEYGATHPAQRRFVIIGAALLSFFLLVGSMAPSYAPESVANVKGMLGGATAGNA
ncbi:UDP-galactofuranose transporter [Aspergillus stella-maris]|uniref:UDP-galactofuranose transporter n=1 Tax=Aspergillus stella-maris TaxID=1810926 RepID=UPI003CCD956F